jgi:hypothetical protein
MGEDSCLSGSGDKQGPFEGKTAYSNTNQNQEAESPEVPADTPITSMGFSFGKILKQLKEAKLK